MMITNNSLASHGWGKVLHYTFLLIFFLIALLYACANFFGDDPSLQVSVDETSIPIETSSKIKQSLQQSSIPILSFEHPNAQKILIRFFNADAQFKAKELLSSVLPENYIVALHLAPAVPEWLAAIGAHPMPLGLDLRGGVHLTLEVDTQGALAHTLETDQTSMIRTLRTKNIHYSQVVVDKLGQVVRFEFSNVHDSEEAYEALNQAFKDYDVTKNKNNAGLSIRLKPSSIQRIQDLIVEQTMNTLRNRVNELGVSEAIVQQMGNSRISVDLPGIQDSAHAKEILGGTATIELHLVNEETDPISQLGEVPFGSQLFQFEGRPVILKKQIILHGKSISDARPSYGQEGQPAVSIELGSGDALFYKETRTNVGKFLATVFVEAKTHTKIINGQEIKIRSRSERVINVARIQEALGRNFQVTGLSSEQEARNLSLLLRAGALPANIEIMEERVVGPKLGLENIHRGMMSLAFGLGAIIIFMTVYYHLFGIVANLALCLNLIFLTALLSILGATLTFAGIAGIVLTLGMAVDASVLIFERIREELRQGISPQGSIKAGFERAFSTILDANVTTFIVAFLLFTIGSGAVKGFAVTLSLGLLTSMLTAVMYSRAIVNLIHRQPGIKHLSIGI